MINTCANCGSAGVRYHIHVATGRELYGCADDECNHRITLKLLGVKERETDAGARPRR